MNHHLNDGGGVPADDHSPWLGPSSFARAASGESHHQAAAAAVTSFCPCPDDNPIIATPHRRFLEEEDSTTSDNGATWEIVYTCIVLLGMFLALISDRIGADSVMMTALTAFLAAEIITIQEGLVGFSNQGLLTVLVLFVVAEGISKTGALDWYMGKLLGAPATIASAQLRLMVPIAVVSAFLNNTPVVAVMIPIVQRWAKNNRMSAQQLLIPLSFASILGGTCTLIGTSTNLVVVGLLEDRYPNDAAVSIGLFDLGEYGVPVAMAGVAYILLLGPFLLPGGQRSNSGQAARVDTLQNQDDILLGARLTQWSPAAGRTVQRSGLRDTGGIFLVSVHRAATGNVHRAVSKDFVLQVGDILYFTGLVESFGDFCEEHGLEVVTNEVEASIHHGHDGVVSTTPTATAAAAQQQQQDHSASSNNTGDGGGDAFAALKIDDQQPDGITNAVPRLLDDRVGLAPVQEDSTENIPVEVGLTKESLLRADEEERLRNIHRMTDLIRGDYKSGNNEGTPVKKVVLPSNHKNRMLSQPVRRVRQTSADARLDPTKIVVTIDGHLVVVGINARDRPGLLLDISKGLLRLHLELRHTEAAVVDERSISIWRCEVTGTDLPDLEEIWSVLNALLSTEGGIEAVKKRGLRVIRASVVSGSRLVGKTAAEVDFRQVYKAAIVAVQGSTGAAGGSKQHAEATAGAMSSLPLSSVRFHVGDTLVLQASDDSPLLVMPPDGFYDAKEAAKEQGTASRSSSVQSLVSLVARLGRTASTSGLEADQSTSARVAEVELTAQDGGAAPAADSGDDDEFFIPSGDDSDAEVGMDNDVEIGPVELQDGIEELENQEKEDAWRDLQVVRLTKEEGEAKSREFLTAMEVAPGSKLAGKTATQIGINKLPDIFLVSIDRPTKREEPQEHKRRKVVQGIQNLNEALSVGESSDIGGSTILSENVIFTAITQVEPLREGDILWFAGSASSVGDLRKIPGLISYELEEVEKINEKVFDRRLVQAVVARKGDLVGKTVKEIRFRSRYGAAVIAVHREGKRVHEHPGKVKLLAGDVLLLEAGPSFIAKSAENDRSFALLAEVENSAPPRLSLLIPALLIAAAMLIVFTAELTSLLVSALVAAILMVCLGILSEQEARDAVNWEVYITIAAAFGIGTALVNSGVADAVANFLVDVGTAVGMGDAGLYGAVYFATFLISNVVTNNAAAALLFPIAMNAAEKTGTDRRLMSFALMLGASASFMSPFGYTTNLLIYGPGGYRYNDFLFFGTPMQIVLWVLSTAYLVIRPWYISWLATGVLLCLIVATRVCHVSIPGIGKGNNRDEEIEQKQRGRSQ